MSGESHGFGTAKRDFRPTMSGTTASPQGRTLPYRFAKFSFATLIMSLMRLSWFTSEAPGS